MRYHVQIAWNIVALSPAHAAAVAAVNLLAQSPYNMSYSVIGDNGQIAVVELEEYDEVAVEQMAHEIGPGA